MRKFNELKISVLDFLKDGKIVTSKILAPKLGISSGSSKMVLLRLHRGGCLERKKQRLYGGRGRLSYQYEINKRGLSKLEFYRNRE